MSKVNRLFNILLQINTKNKFTVQELANEFNVSKRTILRDLEELSTLGIPLYSERGPHGGYRLINKNGLLPPITFSENEAISLFFACQSLQYYDSIPFEHESKSALNKFYNYLPQELKKKIDSMSERVLFITPTRQEKTPLLKNIMDAAIDQEVIQIEYESKRGFSKRIIQPIGIYSSNGYWYMPAYCFNRQQNRLFRIDRIRMLEFKNNFPQKKDFSNLTLTTWFEKTDEKPKELIKLFVILTREGILKCDFNIWLRDKIKILDDGTGLIDTYLNKNEIGYMSEFFLGLGDDIEVKHPIEIITLIKEKASAILNKYE
ncbi:helix-turn-helix transcriptional regulator [Bacillus wiedmannii]|uniref:helix-turn-helix transcriptional regulator n=1 Tax=Bacillus wiedmannii TaxID=1890302 RepID=UPI00085758EA|nr:YafY family protein [Bacillus wiedmannii]PEL91432.1 YafY family transcriptional regulator [Bacillus wiedmannii]QWH69874.1 YafY family transcriptional regulator [Bacillus wiedmannii]SCM11919.1 Uncharacterized protein BCRIVMBC120_05703 [Bacillus wiedmannii]